MSTEKVTISATIDSDMMNEIIEIAKKSRRSTSNTVAYLIYRGLIAVRSQKDKGIDGL